MPGTSTKTRPIQFRLTPGEIADLDQLAAAISPAGTAISKAGAVKFGISAAFEKLGIARTYGDSKKIPKKSRKIA